MNTEEGFVDVKHINCSGIAFKIKDINYEIGDPIHSHNVLLNNGKNPEPGDTMICGSCNRLIRLYIETDNKNIVARDY